MTQAHSYPWDANPADLPGFDRILLSSKYNPCKTVPVRWRWLFRIFDKINSKPVTWSIPTESLKDATVQNARCRYLLMIFSHPLFVQNFNYLLMENVLLKAKKNFKRHRSNRPCGQIDFNTINRRYISCFNNNSSICFAVDWWSHRVADGFVVDFIRLLINRKERTAAKDDIHGKVLVKGTEAPVPRGKSFTADNTSVITNNNGSLK